MDLTEFQKLLKQTMGLDAASVGESAIDRAVQRRLAACSLEDRDAYLAFVRSSDAELQELIEAVIVPETWFFRDAEAYRALVKVVLEEWLPAHAEGTLRLLSAPCSTGEEPYSMAMALLDAGLAGRRFHIDAVDISAHALAHAQRAVYGRNSFRGRNLRFRDRYFQSAPHGHHLAEAVRNQVRLRQANVLEADAQSDSPPYDIIFCRNLLIYFDRPTQDRVIQALGRRLTQQGLVFVGAAETGLMSNHNFVSAKLPLAFAFRKARPVPLAKPAPRVTVKGILETTVARIPRPPVQRPTRLSPASPTENNASVVGNARPEADLERAQRLADEGRLLEAARLCEMNLRQQGHSAKAFFLLGLVRDAEADVEAASEYYRKALYLDPTHYEALMHLACLTEKTGDRGSAQVLRNRARRLKERR